MVTHVSLDIHLPPDFPAKYAPTIIKTGRFYRMWFTDVSKEPWVIRHAESLDGRSWRATIEPVVELDQQWEKGRLFYPTVVKIGGAR